MFAVFPSKGIHLVLLHHLCVNLHIADKVNENHSSGADSARFTPMGECHVLAFLRFVIEET